MILFLAPEQAYIDDS